MTSELPRAEPRLSADAAALIALLSPVLAGVSWAGLSYVCWRSAADPALPGLSVATAFLAVLAYGLLGLGALLVPLMIGLVTRSALTRLAAAWVEAVICALAAVLWLLEVVSYDLPGSSGLLAGLAAVVMLVPLAVTGVVTRYLMRSTDAGRA